LRKNFIFAICAVVPTGVVQDTAGVLKVEKPTQNSITFEKNNAPMVFLKKAVSEKPLQLLGAGGAAALQVAQATLVAFDEEGTLKQLEDVRHSNAPGGKDAIRRIIVLLMEKDRRLPDFV
jgi:hypothetical protein